VACALNHSLLSIVQAAMEIESTMKDNVATFCSASLANETGSLTSPPIISIGKHAMRGACPEVPNQHTHLSLFLQNQFSNQPLITAEIYRGTTRFTEPPGSQGQQAGQESGPAK
jgi:hypothetical protein